MSKNPLFSKYLKELSAVARQGDAREESFYPALADMLADVAQSSGRDHVQGTIGSEDHAAPRCSGGRKTAVSTVGKTARTQR